MPTYTPPQVDHNLYQTQLPQSRMMEVFNLLEQKQGLYNQGLAQARNTISNMDNLPNQVLSPYSKELTTNFNQRAKEKIQEYSNLDFSMQSNVDLISNIYDPLLEDETFLADYGSTRNLNTQVKKAMSFRDSAKKDMYDRYSDTNLQHLYNQYDDLANATTEASALAAAKKSSSARYIPYTDYKKTIRDLVTSKSFFVTEDSSPLNNGYMISYKGVKYKDMKKFLEGNLTEKELGQMRVEGEVAFFNAYKNSGEDKSQFVFDSTKEVIEATSNHKKEVGNHLKLLNDELASYGSDKVLNDKQRAQKAALIGTIKSYEAQEEALKNQIEEADSSIEKFASGQLTADQIYNTLQSGATSSYINGTIDQMARGFNFQSTTMPKDETYWARASENRLSARLRQDIIDSNRDYNLNVQKFAAEQLEKRGKVQIGGRVLPTLEAQKMIMDLAADGLKFDPKTGEIVLMTEQDFKSKVFTPGGESIKVSRNIDNLSTRLSNARSKIKTNTTNTLLDLVAQASPRASREDLKSAIEFLEGSNNTKNPNALSNLMDKRKGNTISDLIEQTKNKNSAVHRGLSILKEIAGGNSELNSNNVLELVAQGVENKLKNNPLLAKQGLVPGIRARYQTNDIMAQAELAGAMRSNQNVVEGFKEAYPELAKGVSLDNSGNIIINPFNYQTKTEGSATGLAGGVKTTITTDKVRSKSSIEDALNEYLNTNEGNDALLTGYTEMNITNPVEASAFIFNNKENYTKVFTNLKAKLPFNADIVDNNEGYDNADGLWESEKAEFLNSLVQNALSSPTTVNLSNKNLSPPINRIVVDLFGNHKLYFNAEHLEKVNGMRNNAGVENTNYDGEKNGVSVDAQRQLIQVLATEGVTIENPDKSGGVNSNLLIESLRYMGIPAPVKSAGGTYAASLSYNPNTKGVDFRLDVPEDYYLYNNQKMYTFAEGKFTPNMINDGYISYGAEDFGYKKQTQILNDINSVLNYSESIHNQLQDSRIALAVDALYKDVDLSKKLFNMDELEAIIAKAHKL